MALASTTATNSAIQGIFPTSTNFWLAVHTASPGTTGANCGTASGPSSRRSDTAPRIAASASAHGTDAADSKMIQSCSRFPAT